MTVLQSGAYYIELEATQPVSERALGRAMAGLGFRRVVPDQLPIDPQALVGSAGDRRPGPVAAPPPRPAYMSPVQRILSAWTNWHAHGTPTPAAMPGGAPSVQGVEDVVRRGGRTYPIAVLGELGQAIEIRDMPQIRWTKAIPLAMKPFEAMTFQLQPFQLRTGKMYELRFLSRVKSAPTREAVAQMLVGMGFNPLYKLLAITRHMKIPNRPGADLSVWFAIAQWSRPDSVVVTDDPFFFINVYDHMVDNSYPITERAAAS